MLDTEKSTELERTQELFDFLQGAVPEGYKIKKSHVPKLTAEQASTAVWYLQNLYWQPPDHIERCDVCGDLFNSHSEGDCLDYGSGPYHFCGSCCDGQEYAKKNKRNQDKSRRS